MNINVFEKTERDFELLLNGKEVGYGNWDKNQNKYIAIVNLNGKRKKIYRNSLIGIEKAVNSINWSGGGE